MREILGISTQVTNLILQQNQISSDLAHNTDLTQLSWGMNTSLVQDTSIIYTRLRHGIIEPYKTYLRYS